MLNKHERTEGQNAQGLASAMRLARKGCYAEATEELADTLEAGACSELEALDLQARIYAQQGMLLNAEACWRKAQQLDPENPSYADALAELRRIQRPYAAWGARAAYAISALFLLAGMALLAFRGQEDPAQLRRLEEHFAQLEKSVSNMGVQSAAGQETVRTALSGLSQAGQLALLNERVVAWQQATSNEWKGLRLELQQLAGAQQQRQEALSNEASAVAARLQAIARRLDDREGVWSNAVAGLAQQAEEKTTRQQSALTQQQKQLDNLLVSASSMCDTLQKSVDKNLAERGQTLARIAKELDALEAAQAKARERELQRYQTGLFGLLF
jgi:hypothetical protein